MIEDASWVFAIAQIFGASFNVSLISSTTKYGCQTKNQVFQSIKSGLCLLQWRN